MIRISIIVPLFNKAAYVEETLHRLQSQLQVGDEIIVVDDVSTDESPALAASLVQQPWGRFVRLERNGGPATARNEGARLASGSHLLFFDADDIPTPALLCKLRDAISCFPLHHVFSYRIAFEAHGESLATSEAILHSKPALLVRERHAFAADSLNGHALCTASSTSVSREAFLEAGGFQEGLRYCEDPELWARLSARYEVVQLNDTLATYRDVPMSLSYGLRTVPGSVDPYANTLMQLHHVHGGPYRPLARSLVFKNLVFSRVGGAPGRTTRTYLWSKRAMLSPWAYRTMVLLSLVPVWLWRLAMKLRNLRKKMQPASCTSSGATDSLTPGGDHAT